MTQRITVLLAALLWAAVPLMAQEPDTTKVPTGVRIGLIYQTSYRDRVAVRPLEAQPGAEAVAGRIEAILRRDLGYSDRFEMTTGPGSLATGPVDYTAWNDLDVTYLVTGAVEPRGEGYLLRLAVHDIVYEEVKEIQAFQLPAPNASDFRMAVHSISDRIVEWLTGDPGMAASRIVFVRRNASGGHDLMIVDSDGENVRRLASGGDIVLSPTWSADGRRIAYATLQPTGWQIHERDLETGEVKVVAARPGLNYTPAYAPDARHLAFAATHGSGSAIYEVNAARQCCEKRLTSGIRDDLSPTYSPDGRWIAFNSNRLGQPHIYVMPRDGGEAELLSPFVYGEPGYYTSPDWSPTGALVAFHGRSRGGYQIMIADANRPGAEVRQVTSEGVSEDPSWAPDGRHVVFRGVRKNGPGLYVLDTVSGRLRPLVMGGQYVVPDWSPTLEQASERSVSGP